MKKSLAVAGIATLVAACADAPTVPRSLSGSGPSLAATTTTTHQRIDNSFVADLPCANGGLGESIQFSGVLHVHQHLTVSNSGNRVLKSTFNSHGITGVGLVTGDTYHGAGTTQHITQVKNPLPFSSTAVNNSLLIGPGPGNNLQINEVIHTTVNANGEITSTAIHLKVECK